MIKNKCKFQQHKKWQNRWPKQVKQRQEEIGKGKWQGQE